MRLAHCTRAIFPQHGYGGLERAGTALTRYLLRRGVDVSLFTRALPAGEPFRLGNRDRETGIRDQGSGIRDQEFGSGGHRQNDPTTDNSKLKTPDPRSLIPDPYFPIPGQLTVHPVRYGRLPLRPNGIPARLTNYKAFVDEMGLRVERMARKGYVQGVYAQGLCAWGVRRASEWGVPLVANPQGMEDFKVRDPLKRLAYAPFRAWVRAGCHAADRVIATDHANRHEAPVLLGVDPQKVVVIPNGVDISEIEALIDPSTQKELVTRWPALGRIGMGDGGLGVAGARHASPLRDICGISVGRLEANKGFEYLLRALASVAPLLGDSWTWIIVGDGSLRTQLQSLAGELGLGERVIFAGQRSDQELHNLYALATMFAHPTLYEGSSLVTLEAMAHNLPVVASAVGGIPDKIIEGESGFLVAPADWQALGAKIAWIASHPDSVRQMGVRGRKLAEERFSWSQIAAQTEELFLELIEEKSACRGAEVKAGR